MQLKNCLLKFLVLISANFFLFNFALAQSDDMDTPTEQEEYYDNTDDPNQVPKNTKDMQDNDSEDEDSTKSSDQTTDASVESNDTYIDE